VALPGRGSQLLVGWVVVDTFDKMAGQQEIEALSGLGNHANGLSDLVGAAEVELRAASIDRGQRRVRRRVIVESGAVDSPYRVEFRAVLVDISAALLVRCITDRLSAFRTDQVLVGQPGTAG